MGNFKGFTSVELRKPKRSKFDLSHERKLSGRMGKLIPIFISEALPNDTFSVRSEVMLRLAPLLAPIMHQINVFVHYFFVPNRLLWEDWEDFITGGRLGTYSTDPSTLLEPLSSIKDILALGFDALDNSSLADYLGVPKIADADAASWVAGTQYLDMLPFAAYQKVCIDYYLDRNYIEFLNPSGGPLLPLPSDDLDPNVNTEYQQLFRLNVRNYEKDYFTSALPWTQRGAEVLMPMEVRVSELYNEATGVLNTQPGDLIAGADAAAGSAMFVNTGSVPQIELRGDNASITINDVRRANRLQEWLERNALAGSRYTESIMAHFARKSSDARLQRAEYLGGGKVPVKISEVLTTAYSQDGSMNDVPPANMAGHGVSFGKSNYFKYNCEEHGFVIGVMSCMPRTNYFQGLPRMFNKRRSFLDYPWPAFAHLGEQAVLDSEVYLTPANSNRLTLDEFVFGYQSRYAEWKYMSSTVHGDFRDSLDFWHLARKFSSAPTLGTAFVSFEDSLQDRVFAVSGSDTLWCMIYNQASVVRSLPYFGTPRM